MRCRAVSRAWRAALADSGCWRNLRFSGEDLPKVCGRFGGIAGFILAAGRAAGGAAEEIDARGLPWSYCGGLNTRLRKLAEENGVSLRVLRVSGIGAPISAAYCNHCDSVASWVGSGKLPRLEELEADVRADSVGEARRLLDEARQPDGRFKALRIRTLYVRADGVSQYDGQYRTPEKEREVAESLAEMLQMVAAPGHPSLTGLTLHDMPLLHPGLIDAAADAAVACGLESLHLNGPYIDQTCLPALSRALRCGHLRSLEATACWNIPDAGGGAPTRDGPRGSGHEEFCAALRESRLERLALQGMRLLAEPDNVRALLAALTSHPTLRSLGILGLEPVAAASRAAAAEAIAALLEANSPTLKSLCVKKCGLDGEHLERILGALRGNTHIKMLSCAQYGSGARGVDEAFAKRVVLPLVRAKAATLQALEWDGYRCGATGKAIDFIVQARGDVGCSSVVTWWW